MMRQSGFSEKGWFETYWSWLTADQIEVWLLFIPFNHVFFSLWLTRSWSCFSNLAGTTDVVWCWQQRRVMGIWGWLLGAVSSVGLWLPVHRRWCSRQRQHRPSHNHRHRYVSVCLWYY
jgi:hypothetical protein